MGSTKFCEFGLTVKKRLLDLGITQKELEGRISERTGLYVDHGYMYKIMTGQLSTPKIVTAICEILEIEHIAENHNKEAV